MKKVSFPYRGATYADRLYIWEAYQVVELPEDVLAGLSGWEEVEDAPPPQPEAEQDNSQRSAKTRRK